MTEVTLELSPGRTRFQHRDVPDQERTQPRTPIDGLLIAVMPLPEAAFLREDPTQVKEERLALCARSSQHPNRCADDEAPAMEARRRERAATALWTPAPQRIRQLFLDAYQDPIARDWPEFAPPCPCAVLDQWRQNRVERRARR